MEMLDQNTKPDVVIASSSSGLPSSQSIQRCQKNPSRILIAHPFNPPHLIPLVEVVPNPITDTASISATMEFYKSLGKRPILIHQEVPGFVANRLQAAINNEAYSLISRGIVSAEDLDAAVTSGPGLRWGLTGPILTNGLGGGGGPEGFAQRIERLGPSIRSWEEDISKHRFDWSDERLSVVCWQPKQRHRRSSNALLRDSFPNAALLQLYVIRNTLVASFHCLWHVFQYRRRLGTAKSMLTLAWFPYAVESHKSNQLMELLELWQE